MTTEKKDLSPTGLAEKWEKEIQFALKEREKFNSTAEKIVRRYLDKRDGVAQVGEGDGVFKVNLFWSNVQVLKSTLYARPPKVDVSRRYKDSSDDVARVAGLIMERMLNSDLESDLSDFDVAAKQGIEDWLIVGMGQLWYRYEVTTEHVPMPVVGMAGVAAEAAMEGESPAEEYAERIVKEDALSEYVFWKDFLWSPCRTWEECRWVGKAAYLNRDQLVKRFGEKIGNAAPISGEGKKLTGKTSDDNQPQNNTEQKARVWEIWCRETRQVYWHIQGYGVILDAKPDPLQLRNFFPCPKPLCSNLTTSNFMPRADYVMVQDQYETIDELSTRIAWLTRACKASGLYDKNNEGIKRLFQTGTELQLIPVDSWAAFAEKGGIKGNIEFIPIETFANVIKVLREQRAAAQQEIYEILGISDIMRGATRATETATAQQIKAQFGSTRLQFKQSETGEWVRDAQRIKAEIIAKHFQAETIIERSNIEHTPDAELAQQAVAFIKGDPLSQYRITIEDESMAALDWASERDARTQFLGALGSFVQQSMPLIQAAPEAAPVLLEMLKWGLAGFRVGKTIEGVIDKAIAMVQQSVSQPKPPPQPTPMEQAEVEQKQADAMQKKSAAAKNMVETRNMSVMQPNPGLPPLTMPPTGGFPQ